MPTHVFRLTTLATLLAALFSPAVHATSFTIADGETATQQTLTNKGDTGIVEEGGTISTSEEYGYAIYSTATNGTIINRGTITTSGSSGYGIYTYNAGNASITNSGTITTTGSRGLGIYASDANAIITNNGTITTTGSTGLGIWSDGTSATITNSGTINTSGGSAHGICSQGDDATIINRGTITTSGYFGHGIYAGGDDATITNNGTITTTGSTGFGIWSEIADNATITNNGTITTTGSTGFGIRSDSNNNTITNNGTISTSGYFGFGIDSAGANPIITNSGSISTVGDYGHGIDSSGVNSTISNSGSISTVGDYGHGIESSGDNTTITSSGSISATGDAATGIYSTGSDATILNTGTLTTSGNALNDGSNNHFPSAIYASGANATIINSGMISTSNTSGFGIFSDKADNPTIINNGSITTSGVFGCGIYSWGDNSTISNSGTISTSGINGHGILSRGAYATITNSGTITVSGKDAIGIYSSIASSETATLHISGSITATGSATKAIIGEAGNETLNLYSSAKIVGTIDLGGGTNTVNLISGAGTSGTYTISNAGTITQSGSGLSFVNGDTVTMVDTTNLTAGQATLGALSSNISQSINTQLNSPLAMHKSIKVASNGSDAGIWANDTQPMAWGRVFGKYTIQDSHGAALGFTDHSYGLIGGYEQSIGDHRAGLFGGVSQSNTDTDDDAGELGSDGIFVGAYGQYVNGNWQVNGALALGFANYDSERQVNDNVHGIETASADYRGWYVSPSVALTRIFDMPSGISIRPSVEVNYTYGRQDGYTESGTTRSNLSVGSRTAEVLNTRLQLAVRQDFFDQSGQAELRGGLSHTEYGDDSTAITLQGVGTTHYALAGTGSITGAYVGLSTRVHHGDDMNIVGDIEVFNSDGMDFSIMAYAGMEYWF